MHASIRDVTDEWLKYECWLNLIFRDVRTVDWIFSQIEHLTCDKNW